MQIVKAKFKTPPSCYAISLLLRFPPLSLFIFQDCLDSFPFLGEMLSKFQIGSGDQQSKHMLNYSNLLKSKSNPIVASVVCQNNNAEFVLRKYQVYLSTKISGHMNSGGFKSMCKAYSLSVSNRNPHSFCLSNQNLPSSPNLHSHIF